jgi:RNA polymerase sigma-70 factor, ECF subfamily
MSAFGIEGFEALYRAHFAFAWKSLARLGVPERDLGDAVQDVFVIAYRKLGQFDGSSRASTWIYGICLRVASDRRRSASARYEVLSDPESIAAIGHGAGDAAAVQLAHGRELLDLGLGAMPLEQRAVFTLFELDGLSGDEIAGMLQIPAATVHSRLRLARATFRRALARVRAREHFDSTRAQEPPRDRA